MTNLLICIKNEADAMAELVELLRKEQEVLTRAPSQDVIEELSRSTLNKNHQITRINQLGQIRRNQLVRSGFPFEENTMPAWLQDQEQKDCWAALIKHTKKARELNRVNGLLINKHLMRNRSTLQVLSKLHRVVEMPTLYSANGQSNRPRSLMRGFSA